MKSGDYVQNSIVSLSTKVIMQQHLVCSSCASSAAFPECLDRAQSGGKALRWFEGRVAGRMFRRIWPSFLSFFSPSSFLIPLCISFLLPSLPSFFHLNNHFLHSSFSTPHFLSFKKISPRNSCFPSLVQDFRSAVTEVEGEDGEPVLEEQRLGEILGVLPQVYTLHSSILTELEERISQW